MLSSSPSPSIKAQISVPQNFKHVYHMDTSDPLSVNDSEEGASTFHKDDDAHKPSPSSITSSLFSDDYFNQNHYPGTPSSPISNYTSNIHDPRLQEKLSLGSVRKKNSTSTIRTSMTNSVNSNKRADILRTTIAPNATSGFDEKKYLSKNAVIREDKYRETDPQSQDSLLASNEPATNPFLEMAQTSKNIKNLLLTNEEKSYIDSRSRKNSTSSLLSQDSNISGHSRRLLESEAVLENSSHILKRNKFLNESTPMPKFNPPALPASPAHTNHSEESSQTIQYNDSKGFSSFQTLTAGQLLQEDCTSPISTTATYTTPKLSEVLNEYDQPQLGIFERPSLSTEGGKNVKKSRSFKNLKKSFGKHFQSVALNKKMQFKGNDCNASVGSDKDLTGFSPDIETNTLSNQVSVEDLSASKPNVECSTEMLKHFSFEQKSKDLSKHSFAIDFDKEVENIKSETFNRTSNASKASRNVSVASSLSSSQNNTSLTSNFSAVSYNMTKPMDPAEELEESLHKTGNSISSSAKNRRSSVFIRQSWLKDEALAILRNSSFDESTKPGGFQSSSIIEEEDVLPLNINSNKRQGVTKDGALNDSYDSVIVGKTAFGGQQKLSSSVVELEDATKPTDLDALENEIDSLTKGKSAFLLRRRSENDIENIAMLQVDTEEGPGDSALVTQDDDADLDPKQNFKNLKKLTLHTPHYLLDENNALPPSATSGSFSSTKNTFLLATPTRKFGHGKSLSIASSVYSNGTGHSRSSSLYNNEAVVNSAEILSTRKPSFDLNHSSSDLNSNGSPGPAPKKKIGIDRNSYIQFQYNRIDDFRSPTSLNRVHEVHE